MARFRASLKKIDWGKARQSLVDGAGNTLGAVLVYSIVILIVFLWYRNVKKDDGEANHPSNAIESALSLSKPAATLRTITASGSFGSSITPDATRSWI